MASLFIVSRSLLMRQSSRGFCLRRKRRAYSTDLRSEALKIVQRLKQRTFEDTQPSDGVTGPVSASASIGTLGEFVASQSPQPLSQEQIKTVQQNIAQDVASLKHHAAQTFELYHRIERQQEMLRQADVTDVGPSVQAWLKKSEASEHALTIHRDAMQQLSVDDIFSETAADTRAESATNGASIVKDASTFAALLGLEKTTTFLLMSTPSITKHLQSLMLAGDVKQAVLHASMALDQVRATDVKFYTVLLYIFRGRKNTMLIRKTLERIKRDFPDPAQYDTKLCTLLLQVYGELGDLKQLGSLMQDMRRLHIPIDVHVYNTLINIFIDFNDRGNVMRILEEMKKSNIEPNAVTFAALLKYFAEQGDIDQTISLARLASSQELMPLETILSKLLVYFTRTGRPGTTLRLLRELYHNNIKIGASFYVPVMQRLRDSKNHRDLLEVFSIARENQVELPEDAFLYVLDVAVEKESRDVAMSAFGYSSKEKPHTTYLLDRIRDKVLK